MLFGRKLNPNPVKANMKCLANKLLNPFYYLCKRLDIRWSKVWYKNPVMWGIINDPANRLVPFFS